ncbi:MAG: T9SS C-terminal target domain-containing protein [Deltaproteobacteria bacterium]|jgi:hypothetical protein|nr:T9SS C-terminal target domain-containing protein [Deltaproteobacteria bacterium]
MIKTSRSRHLKIFLIIFAAVLLLAISIFLAISFKSGPDKDKYAPNIKWQRSLGGSAKDSAESIQITSDGGYIIAGVSSSNDGDVTGNHGDDDYWIVKLDPDGNIEWQKSLGGSGKDYARSIRITSDGGYIIAGASSSKDGDVTENHGDNDYWIVKLDPEGNIIWQKSLGGSGEDSANSIHITSDDGYIIAGTSNSNDGDVTENHGNNDYWIVKIDSLGTIQWQKSLGGSESDVANSIRQTSDGGYIIAGRTKSNDGDITGNHGKNDSWIVKIDSEGAIQWQKSLGGSQFDEANSIRQTSDGGYIIAGESESYDGDVTVNHGRNDFWIVKLDSLGTIQWQKSLGGQRFDFAKSIQITSDGGYIIAGGNSSDDFDVTGNHGYDDFWIVKLDSLGNIQWQKSLGGSSGDFASSIQITSDDGYIIAGYTLSNDGDVTINHGEHDYWIVKLQNQQNDQKP